MSDEIKIGASILTLFPKPLPRIVEIAVSLGIGLQLVPSPRMTLADLEAIKNLEEKLGRQIVLSYEGDWRKPTLVQTVHKAFTQGDLVSLLSPLIFGSRNHVNTMISHIRELFPRAMGVDLGAGSLAEVSPANSSDLKYCLESQCASRQQPGVVIDTLHVREFPHLSPDHIIRALVAARNIELIHLQTPDSDELDAFIRMQAGGEVDILRKILGHALMGCRTVIIELPPQFLWHNPRGKLSEIATAIRSCIT